MPESVSTVDAILDGLRERATGWSCVPLPDAVAAVHAAADAARSETWDAAQAEIEAAKRAAADARTQEIVEEIRDGITMIADNEFEEGANAALESALGLIARRFPNGGTDE